MADEIKKGSAEQPKSSKEKPAKAEKSSKTKKESKAKKDSMSGKDAAKQKKGNIFVRMGRKIKETFSELKRVTWPSFGKALKATGVVLVVVLVFTVVFTGINYGLSELLDLMTSVGS